MIGLTRIYKVNGHYVVAKSPEDAIRIYQEGEDDKIKDILEVRLLADGKYPDFAYIDKWEPTEETELNSIAFLEQLGYTCIPPGAEQKPTNSEKPKAERASKSSGRQSIPSFSKSTAPRWNTFPLREATEAKESRQDEDSRTS